MTSNDKSSDDRRLYKRIPVTIRVNYKNARDFFVDYSTNISAGGMFIKTDQSVDYGTKILLRFILPEFDKPIRGLGEVVRIVSTEEVTGNPEDSNGVEGIGVRFLKFDDDSKQNILEFIKKFQDMIRTDPNANDIT